MLHILIMLLLWSSDRVFNQNEVIDELANFACEETRIVHDYFTTMGIYGLDAALQYKHEMITEGYCVESNLDPSSIQIALDFKPVVILGQRQIGYIQTTINGRETNQILVVDPGAFKATEDI